MCAMVCEQSREQHKGFSPLPIKGMCIASETTSSLALYRLYRLYKSECLSGPLLLGLMC